MEIDILQVQTRPTQKETFTEGLRAIHLHMWCTIEFSRPWIGIQECGSACTQLL